MHSVQRFLLLGFVPYDLLSSFNNVQQLIASNNNKPLPLNQGWLGLNPPAFGFLGFLFFPLFCHFPLYPTIFLPVSFRATVAVLLRLRLDWKMRLGCLGVNPFFGGGFYWVLSFSWPEGLFLALLSIQTQVILCVDFEKNCCYKYLTNKKDLG